MSHLWGAIKWSALTRSHVQAENGESQVSFRGNLDCARRALREKRQHFLAQPRGQGHASDRNLPLSPVIPSSTRGSHPSSLCIFAGELQEIHMETLDVFNPATWLVTYSIILTKCLNLGLGKPISLPVHLQALRSRPCKPPLYSTFRAGG